MRIIKSIAFYAFFLIVLAATDVSAQEASAGKVYWNGMVDNKVQIVVKGLTLEQRTTEGRMLEDGSYSFTAPLPSSTRTVSVTKIDGRSNRVSVIQQPTSENDFTAIVEIHDDRGGADEFFIEISW